MLRSAATCVWGEIILSSLASRVLECPESSSMLLAPAEEPSEPEDEVKLQQGTCPDR